MSDPIFNASSPYPTSDPISEPEFNASAELLPSSQRDDEYLAVPSDQSSVITTDDEATMKVYDRNVRLEETRLRLSTNPDECRQLLSCLPHTVMGWCKLCLLQPSKEGGYIQVSWKGANKFATLQEVVLWAGGCSLGPGEQCSHLCCSPACFALGHIIAESEVRNQLRKGCLVWVDCPHCSLKIVVCNHGEEKCIKYCDGYADAVAFSTEGLHKIA